MLTEQELVNLIASGNESVILDKDVVNTNIPQGEMRIMMIHNALIHRLDSGTIQIKEVDWASFIDSIFEMNQGLDLINRIQNKQLKNEILRYWIDNYDEIVGNAWRKAPWISKWKELCD